MIWHLIQTFFIILIFIGVIYHIFILSKIRKEKNKDLEKIIQLKSNLNTLLIERVKWLNDLYELVCKYSVECYLIANNEATNINKSLYLKNQIILRINPLNNVTFISLTNDLFLSAQKCMELYQSDNKQNVEIYTKVFEDNYDKFLKKFIVISDIQKEQMVDEVNGLEWDVQQIKDRKNEILGEIQLLFPKDIFKVKNIKNISKNHF